MNVRPVIAVVVATAVIIATAYWALAPRDRTPVSEVIDATQPDQTKHTREYVSSNRFPDNPGLRDAPSTIALTQHGEADDGPQVIRSADAGTDAIEPEWQDPTNARVLGKKTWMAPVDGAEEARIDEVFAAARAARYDPRLPNVSRAASIAAAREVVDRCFGALEKRQPGIQGRLIVAWTAGATGGKGKITNPRINVNYRLADPTFESCILDGLNGWSFQGPDGDSIEVEAPFFFDGSY